MFVQIKCTQSSYYSWGPLAQAINATTLSWWCEFGYFKFQISNFVRVYLHHTRARNRSFVCFVELHEHLIIYNRLAICIQATPAHPSSAAHSFEQQPPPPPFLLLTASGINQPTVFKLPCIARHLPTTSTDLPAVGVLYAVCTVYCGRRFYTDVDENSCPLQNICRLQAKRKTNLQQSVKP